METKQSEREPSEVPEVEHASRGDEVDPRVRVDAGPDGPESSTGYQFYSGLLGVRMQQLAYVDAVATQGSYSAAAEYLQVSQSALSQGIARLERSLGAQLFEPDGRERRLSAEGELALGSARRMLGEGMALVDSLAARSEGKAGRLRLGLIDAAALYIFSDELEAFRQDHPDIELRLIVDTSQRLLDALSNFELDAAIVVGPPPNANSIELRREPLYIYGPRQNIYGPDISGLRQAVKTEAISDATLGSIKRWILYPSRSRTRRYIDESFAARGIIPHVTNESANPSVIAQLVRLGEGYTVLPAGIAESVIDPLSRMVDDTSEPEPFAERPLVAVQRDGQKADVTVARLIETLAG